MSDFVLYHHLGLGDHIIMNGLVRHIYKREAKKCDNFWLVCFDRNEANVKRMYEDLPKIKTLPIHDSPNSGLNALIESKGGKTERIELTGEETEIYYNGEGDDLFFDKYGYDKKLIHKFKTNYSKELWEASLLEGKEYAFIHDEGYPINDGAIGIDKFRPHQQIPIFDYLPFMFAAKEIHVISSSFLCLCIVHPELAKKTTAHLYVRNAGLKKYIESKGIKVL